MKGLILAAGKGTRLEPYTDVMPKPLVTVAGKTALDYVLEKMEKAGIGPIAVNIHHLGNKIVEHLGMGRVRFSIQPELYGTAYALKYLEGWFLSRNDKNILVMNGDTITNIDIPDMIRFHERQRKDITVFTHDDSSHNGGTFIVNRNALKDIPHKLYHLTDDLIPKLERENRVALYKSDVYYFDLGDTNKLKKARRFFNANNGNR